MTQRYRPAAQAAAMVLAATILTVSGTAASPARAPLGCVATPPAEFSARPVRWLGDCRLGRAEGLGVLRFGAVAPYAFFAGEMRSGRPVSGMLINADGLFRPTRSFDAQLQAINPDGNRRAEEDAIFALATRAADATARRFAVAGNAGSAAYYRALAKRIREGQPE